MKLQFVFMPMCNLKKYFFMVAILLLFYADGSAQSILSFQSMEVDQKNVLEKAFSLYAKSSKNSKDSLAIVNQLRKSLMGFQESGYLEARLDSVSNLNGKVAWWYVGPVYKIVEIRSPQEDDYLLSNGGRLYPNKIFSPVVYAKTTNSILNFSTNNGYPFALVRLDSISIDQGKMKASLVVEKGNLVLLDTALIKGAVKVSPAYLYNYLRIQPGSVFDESILRKVSTRLKEIPFLSEARSFEIEFTKDGARPVLYLQEKKASQFNGVIGVQPDNTNPGKVFLTGDVRLRLLNSFGRAELFDLNWSNPLPRSQDLKVKFSYPFLFSLPVGVEGELTLFKRDSIFLELNRQIGFRYFLSGNNSVRFFLGRKTSSLISTKGYENVTTLPPFADVGTNTFGLGFQFQQLDYRLNPRKGFSVDVNSGAGLREIKKNSNINKAVYDSINLKNTQYKAEILFDFYIPVFNRSVINIGGMGAWLESENIFSNEMYRFGGLKTLRGFDEASLLASTYGIGKIEYRFILETNSYLLLFFNQAWFENKGRETPVSDTPYGFGAGITFDTKLGIFSFNYALGSQQENPIEFRAAKIHFGLVNYF
jgi:outer membrane translocation and assembly module TamA